MFIVGTEYRRRDIHEMYGGQKQGGISTPSKNNFIMLFAGEQGYKYGYEDTWTEEGLFLFTGGGQHGDMSFTRGNLAIRDHAANHKDLHLFEYVTKGHVRHVGQMIYVGFRINHRLDIDGNKRRVIAFELMPIDAFDETVLSGNQVSDEEMWQQPIGTLREHAIASITSAKTPTERIAVVRYRSNSIRVYVLRRANGICEACGGNAPFKTHSGRFYLEPHYIKRLSDAGPDDPRWVIGLCPNCHRRAHYSNDRNKFNKQVANIIKEKERQYEKS